LHHEKLQATHAKATEHSEDLDTRLRRLAVLIDSVLSIRTAESALDIKQRPTALAIRRLDAGTTSLTGLTGEIERRLTVTNWDGGDAVCARLLLDELTTILRSCRVLTAASGETLTAAREAVRQAGRMIQRERELSAPDTMPS
jgi:hypothetical protein